MKDRNPFEDFEKQLLERLLERVAKITEADPQVLRRHFGKKDKEQEVLSRLEKAKFKLDDVDPDDVRELEAIIITTRPVLLIYKNEIDFNSLNDGKWEDRLRKSEEKIEKVIPSVGRVEIIREPFRADEGRKEFMVGTCFAITKNLVLTNHHVAIAFCDQRGFIPDYRKVYVDFSEEYGNDPDQELRVKRVVDMDETLDYAVMEIETGGRKLKPLSLCSSREEARLTDLDDSENHPHVFTIGYPAYTIRDNVDRQRAVFDNIFEVKRLSAGRVRGVEGFNRTRLRGDYTTLKGNSGSPVLHLKTGKVIGLHHAGIENEWNFSIAIWQVKEQIEERLGINLTGNEPAELAPANPLLGPIPRIPRFPRIPRIPRNPRIPPHPYPFPPIPPVNPWPWPYPFPPLPWPWGPYQGEHSDRGGFENTEFLYDFDSILERVIEIIRNKLGVPIDIDDETKLSDLKVDLVLLAQHLNAEFFPDGETGFGELNGETTVGGIAAAIDDYYN